MNNSPRERWRVLLIIIATDKGEVLLQDNGEEDVAPVTDVAGGELTADAALRLLKSWTGISVGYGQMWYLDTLRMPDPCAVFVYRAEDFSQTPQGFTRKSYGSIAEDGTDSLTEEALRRWKLKDSTRSPKLEESL